MWWIANGNSRDVLRAMADASVDSVVCDPPYELGFMGKRWDASGIAYDVGLWAEVLRVLKPGGHLLAFGGTRTYHRMACAIEDAGFEVRDSIHWIYGSGFPKSLDVSKAIDKAAGAEREIIGRSLSALRRSTSPNPMDRDAGIKNSKEVLVTAPATEAARQWAGWGTALKPAHEPIVVARKPLDGTVAANVLAHGTGAINVDATRVGYASESDRAKLAAGVEAIKRRGGTMANSWKNSSDLSGANDASTIGRWPPNILLSHAPDCGDECADGCAVAEMDGQSGTLKSGSRKAGEYETQGYMGAKVNPMPAIVGDAGGASRFFPVFRYQAKAPTSERFAASDGTRHPTQKPVALMRWLVRLVTPPNGLVLDPFTGSGSTGVAAVLEGFRFAGVELSPEYVEIARARVAHAEAGRPNTLPGIGVV